MLELVALLLFSSGIAYLALQNTTKVTFNLLYYTFSDIPLFSIIIASMLVGVLMAYVIYTINSITNAFTLHGKDKKIKETEKNLLELTKQMHHLELENERLKKDNPAAETNTKDL